MLSKSASNKKVGNQCHDWAFDLRTQFACSSDDSQSGSESDEATVDNGANRLPIDDLDLSKRQEHVAYKPNPFSIAKINAAHRPTSTVNNSVLQPTTLSDKPTQTRKLTKRSCLDSGQTTIMEGFRTQAMKKPRTNALPQRPNPLALNSNPVINKPVAEKLVVSVSPIKSTLSTPTLLPASAVLTSPCSVSVPNASDFPLISSCAPEYAHILPLKTSQHHDAQMFSKISQSRALTPDRPPPDMLRYQRQRTNFRPVLSSFSSPGPPYNDGPLNHDPRIPHSQAYSSPIQAIRQSSFRPYSMVSLQGKESAFEPSSPIIQIKDQPGPPKERELTDDYVFRTNEDTSRFLRHSPTLPSSSKPLHPAKILNQRQRAEAQPAELSPSPLLMSSTPPNQSNYLARSRIPDNSSTSFKKAKLYPKRDAYQYPIGDPDEEWSTLPSRKKRKPNVAPRNHTNTKSFHIPGLRLPQTMKAETKPISPIRRVKIYLPPPPDSVNVSCSRTNKNSGSKGIGPSMKEIEDGRHVTSSPPPNFVARAYPSPSALNSKPSLPLLSPVRKSQDYTSPRSRGGVGAVASYRPPSPPTSDLPVPSEAMDIHLEVDLEGIQVRYPKVKRLSRKRRRLSAEVWNLLGVDSCGYVWKDVDGGRNDEEVEIKIAVWNGLRRPCA